MQYTLYLSGPNHVIELYIETDTPPEFPGASSEHDVVNFGGISFRRRDFIAILPSQGLKQRHVFTAGK